MKKRKQKKKRKRKYLTLQDKAMLALQEAVRDVIEEHRRTGQPLAIWKDDRVQLVSAKSVLRTLKYRARSGKTSRKK